MRKSISLTIVIAILISLLAGCGTSATNTGAGNSTQSGSTTASNSMQTQEKKKAELNLVLPGLSRFKDQFDGYLKQFADKYNYDLKYDLNMPGGDNSEQLLKAKLAAGGSVDVYALHAVNNIPNYYKAGYLTDLSSQPFVGKLLDSAKNSVTYDGKVCAVPLESVAWGYLYNKKIFQDNGITPPQTLTEMKDVAKKLKEKNITPFLLTYKDAWIPQLFLAYYSVTIYNKLDTEFIEKMDQGKASYGTYPQIFDVMDFVNSYGDSKRMFEVGGDDGAAEFANGKAAMWFQGPWFSESILKANKDFPLGVAPFPMDDDPSHTVAVTSVSTSLAATPDSKNKDVAIDFLNYVLDDQDSNNFYQSMQFNPVANIHTYEMNPWIQEIMTYVKDGKSVQERYIPSAVKDASGPIYQNYYSKKLTRDEAVKELDKAWKDAVANSK